MEEKKERAGREEKRMKRGANGNPPQHTQVCNIYLKWVTFWLICHLFGAKEVLETTTVIENRKKLVYCQQTGRLRKMKGKTKVRKSLSHRKKRRW